MKYKIIGTLVVLLILFFLYVLGNMHSGTDGGDQQQTTEQQ